MPTVSQYQQGWSLQNHRDYYVYDVVGGELYHRENLEMVLDGFASDYELNDADDVDNSLARVDGDRHSRDVLYDGGFGWKSTGREIRQVYS